MAHTGHTTDAGLGQKVSRTNGGIVLTGGVVIALAYWLLPVATVPLLGSVSAPVLVGQVEDVGAFALLRLVPLTALLTVAAGVWLLARAVGRARLIAASAALAAAAVTVVAYLVPLSQVDEALDSSGASETLGIDVTSFIGAGFWLAVIGSVIAATGAIMELATARARR